jgi:hypothetical protein
MAARQLVSTPVSIGNSGRVCGKDWHNSHLLCLQDDLNASLLPGTEKFPLFKIVRHVLCLFVAVTLLAV